jgi:hypothetical protein
MKDETILGKICLLARLFDILQVSALQRGRKDSNMDAGIGLPWRDGPQRGGFCLAPQTVGAKVD